MPGPRPSRALRAFRRVPLWSLACAPPPPGPAPRRPERALRDRKPVQPCPWPAGWGRDPILRATRGRRPVRICAAPFGVEFANQCQVIRLQALAILTIDTLAEWLRRRPAKPMGSPRVGSNPTGVASMPRGDALRVKLHSTDNATP